MGLFYSIEFLDYLGFNKNVIVIDYNGSFRKKSLAKNFLKDNDALEILSIAGGGN